MEDLDGDHDQELACPPDVSEESGDRESIDKPRGAEPVAAMTHLNPIRKSDATIRFPQRERPSVRSDGPPVETGYNFPSPDGMGSRVYTAWPWGLGRRVPVSVCA